MPEIFFPIELAVLADERNKKLLDHQRRQAKLKTKDLTNAKELAATISALSLTIQKPVGEEDKIFRYSNNSGTCHYFPLLLVIKIDRRMISILDDIKLVGVYKGVC